MTNGQKEVVAALVAKVRRICRQPRVRETRYCGVVTIQITGLSAREFEAVRGLGRSQPMGTHGHTFVVHAGAHLSNFAALMA